MSIEYRDVFLKAERFLFECSECFCLVLPGNHDHHDKWHEEEKRKQYGFSR